MKKILLILILTLFLTGCSPGGGGPSIATFDPYQGSEGLTPVFAANSPPDDVREGKDIKIGIKMENKGAFDVNNGRIVLDYNVRDFQVSDPQKSVNLLGKSKLSTNGESDIYFWDVHVSNVKKDLDADIGATVTYRYQTNAFVDICIDPDLFDQKFGKKTCSPKEKISQSSQGAPVGVTEIGTEYFPLSDTSGEIEFEIVVRNLRQGFVYSGSKLNALTVNAQLSDSLLKCDPSEIKLEEGEGKTRCTGSYNTDTEYLTPLHVKLDYVYKETMTSVPIRIKKDYS